MIVAISRLLSRVVSIKVWIESGLSPESLNYFCRKRCPFSVNRYFCNRLLGLSGMVISSNPAVSAGWRYRILKSFLSLMPIASWIASRVISPCTAAISRPTWGVTWGDTWGVLTSPKSAGATAFFFRRVIKQPVWQRNSTSRSYPLQASMMRKVPVPQCSIKTVYLIMSSRYFFTAATNCIALSKISPVFSREIGSKVL